MNKMSSINSQCLTMHAIARSRWHFSLVPKKDQLEQMQDYTGNLLQELFLILLKNLKVQHLIEIGAHKAEISQRFTSDKANTATAFEANPYVYNRFRNEITKVNLEYLNLGISDEKGKALLYTPRHTPKSWSTESSLSKRVAFNDFVETEIEVDRLDNITLDKVSGQETAIWIDVEGNSSKVLIGANQILKSPNCKVLFIEVQETYLWTNEMIAADIANQLHQFGFVPVARDNPLATLFNAIYVKEIELPKCIMDINSFWFACSKAKPKTFRMPNIRHIASTRIGRLRDTLPDRMQPLIGKILSFLGSKSQRDK